jgi:hypothetical protein
MPQPHPAHQFPGTIAFVSSTDDVIASIIRKIKPANETRPTPTCPS